MKVHPLGFFNKELEDIASDKSISQRFAIFSLLAKESSIAKNYLLAEDSLGTLTILKALGAKVEIENTWVKITPPTTLITPCNVLDCGNSGTTMRLLIGLLSGIPGFFVLNGDNSLNKRPMDRICKPLKKIGAKIYGRENTSFAPLCIQGTKLKSFDFKSKISSAQLKTAMILAGFNADSTSFYKEEELSRDHSENMLKAMNAPINISKDHLEIKINPLKSPLKALNITIPNDPSSAFYFALAALILPHSSICLKNILLNKTRIEAYEILRKMGAKITYKINKRDFEDIGEIYVESSQLKAIEIKENISWLIDELPALAIAFVFAKGKSRVRNAKELRVKESDRIKSIVINLKKCGIVAKELYDGFEVVSGSPKKAIIESFNDHRIAMAFAILGLMCGIEIKQSKCIKTSFPNFKDILKNLGAQIED
ncbi:3-phosphoshikimate 1-carboxyvinyltransferase [Campylobacter sp. TTU-622]|uniref:3-phosphoshikimate 1-carboxyvinyltransferase n=1 Tax=Campylobacter sp. TTU-622 TaxID=2800583 RepID=UPI0019077040|nr:3-phosphoshikimate 1-carboxyvinyltransferase [Campylobacter sp. TTU-622]MBK1973209.1 3-phosphoshikimate 1-carboxyvinyltransferase [Campylobacter sp. TTU-622]